MLLQYLLVQWHIWKVIITAQRGNHGRISIHNIFSIIVLGKVLVGLVCAAIVAAQRGGIIVVNIANGK